MPDLAFSAPEARRELLQKVMMEVESKSWKEEEARESAGLLADGNMFYGPDGKPLRKGVRRTAGVLKGLSGGQDMAYVERNRSVNKSVKARKGDRHKFFKSIARENERRRQQPE